MGSCWVPLAAQLLQLWASLYLVAVAGTEAAGRHGRYVASAQHGFFRCQVLMAWVSSGSECGWLTPIWWLFIAK